jgi:hypothetical protein
MSLRHLLVTSHTSGARSNGSKGVALAVLATAQLVIALDYSIVNVALPDIGRSLDFSGGTVQWVISAYALTFGGFLLLGGRAADLLGRRRMVMVALGLLGAASLAAADRHPSADDLRRIEVIVADAVPVSGPSRRHRSPKDHSTAIRTIVNDHVGSAS